MPRAVIVEMVQCYRFNVEAINGPKFIFDPDAVKMGSPDDIEAALKAGRGP